MPRYMVSGPHVIPTEPRNRGGRALVISRLEDQRLFWEQEDEDVGEAISKACGCYIYAIRAGRGITPWYVGQARNRFDHEVFNARNINLYNTCYQNIQRGTPVIFLVIRQTPGGRINGVALPEREANWVEEYLIRRALEKNPGLLNTQRAAYFRTVIIPGIHNERARTPSDRDLAIALRLPNLKAARLR